MAGQDTWKRIGIIVGVWMFFWMIIGQFTYPIVELITGESIMTFMLKIQGVLDTNREAYFVLDNSGEALMNFIQKISTELEFDKYKSSLMWYQGLQAFCGFILSTIALKFILKLDFKKDLGLFKRPGWYMLFFLPLLFNFLFPIISLLGEFNQQLLPTGETGLLGALREMEYQNGVLSMLMGMSNSTNELVGAIVVMALLPAVGEELIFRGLIQQTLLNTKMNPHIAILITGLFFSAVHFQFYSFVPRAALGILLGYLYFWSKSLWAPILGHFINNASMVLLMYLSLQGDSQVDLDSITYDGFVASIFWSFLIVIFILRGMYIRRENSLSTE